LFIDINTNQRPVPNELLLDIKRLAQTETDIEVILHDLFAQFADDPSSPLLGCLSPASKTHGKISKVTFYAAAAPAIGAFEDNDSGYMYSVLSSYLHAWMTVLRQIKAESSIVNPTLFRAVLLLFRDVATRANDRHPGELNNVDHFVEFIEPLVGKVKKTLFIHPGRSHKEIYDHFASALKQQVSLGRKK
jgi:hypothetical protein